MAVKIIDTDAAKTSVPLLISGGSWSGSEMQPLDWENGGKRTDTAWKRVAVLSGIEDSLEVLQGNAYAGLYAWPGYVGISPFLAHIFLPPAAIDHVYQGMSTLRNTDALKRLNGPANETFSAELSSANGSNLEEQRAPSFLLDFGKEVAGRLVVQSASDHSATLEIQYGESVNEAENGPFLGTSVLELRARGKAYGPKSAFRYALVRIIRGSLELRLQSIAAEVIYYPVQYRGRFESSDPQLNRIWEVGAYTAHLCMQDDIWDAPKRDRERWMGDLDVIGRTVNDVFFDKYLMEDTLEHLIGSGSITGHVNGIPGYSAFWIIGEKEYYLRHGSRAQLESFHARLIQLMSYMEKDLDDRGVFAARTGQWPFVDWSPELDHNTEESRRANHFEFQLAFRDGSFLLRELGDITNADRFARRSTDMGNAAQRFLLDPSTGTFGQRWQTNAMAVLAGSPSENEAQAIWSTVLSRVNTTHYNSYTITPYYNYYVLSAMAALDHRKDALQWMRRYWGGMIAEGATSFWEGYDPDWFKGNFHASLQADDQSGYVVSLAHGWSSGPTAWLMDEILGVRPLTAGFRQVMVRPDLAGLNWIRGEEPTPSGYIRVEVHGGAKWQLSLDLPDGLVAEVLVPAAPKGRVLVSGVWRHSSPVEDGRRQQITLDHSGHYLITVE